MKKIFLAMLLVAAVTAVAQTPAAPAQAAPQPNPAPAAAPAAQKKEIKDPAEYNAYVGAVQQTDPAAKDHPDEGCRPNLLSPPSSQYWWQLPSSRFGQG